LAPFVCWPNRSALPLIFTAENADGVNSHEGVESDRWQGFVAFWLVGGIALLVIGIATFAAVRHAHRLGGVIGLAGIVCLAIGLLVWRAGRQAETPR